MTRWILYVDMDAFYVSCELRDFPELNGLPVIVGPDPGKGPTRGVVLSASYEARKFGVHSAQPVLQASRLCPDARWVPADFPKYERVSGEVMGRLERFSADVRPMSIDEAALGADLPGPAEAETLARQIQLDLRESLRLPSSIGTATSRLVAKIATDRAKPAGIRVVPPEDVPAFLAPLPVRAVPGIGPKTEERLREVGVERIGQFVEVPRSTLYRAVGGFADELRRLARGEYADPPETLSGPRSRSTEETFERDLESFDVVEEALGRLSRALADLLARERLRYQTVTVGVRWADFSRVQRSRTLPAAREGVGDLEGTAARLLREIWSMEQSGRGRAVRMISIGAERLVPARLKSIPLDRFDAARGSVK